MTRRTINTTYGAALLVWCAMSFPGVVQAAPLTGSNTVSIVATDNASVSGRSTADNLDESNGLYVGQDYATAYLNFSYLRFDVSSLKRATNIIGATLRIQVTPLEDNQWVNLGIYVRPLTNGVQEVWDSDMTWAGKPTGYGSTLATYQHSWFTSGTKSLSLSTSEMLSLIENDTNDHITLALTSDSTGSKKTERFKFNSLSQSPQSSWPTLYVTGIWPPPKGSVMIIK